MIREHVFNSRWWGAPVGVVDDPGFLDMEPQRQAAACAPYAWVEFSTALSEQTPETLRIAGFNWVDVQIPFRINLRTITSTSSTDRLLATSAEEFPFEIARNQLKPFSHERFQYIPGATVARINERYALWSNLLIARHPEWCLQIVDHDVVQGWFLCEWDDRRLGLTLAMLKSDAHISGHVLYRKAMIEFARRGARIGEASFSAANTSVLNIYANLGARFLNAHGHWLRWP